MSWIILALAGIMSTVLGYPVYDFTTKEINWVTVGVLLLIAIVVIVVDEFNKEVDEINKNLQKIGDDNKRVRNKHER